MSDDLVKRLRKGVMCGDDPVIEEAADRIEELEQLFDLRWAADMRAIKAWQIAHPDQPKTWPDHADLSTWCLSRIEALEAALRAIAAASKVIVKAEDMAQALVVVLTSHRKIALAALEKKND